MGAEEKLNNVTRETQALQTKINAINERIDKIQADIAAKEAALEGEGIPAHKLRDAITQLFKENNLEIDEEMLKDIIQEDEIEETTAMSASILENVNPSAMAPQLEAQRQDLSEKTKTILLNQEGCH